jgi:VWFA-related protein
MYQGTYCRKRIAQVVGAIAGSLLLPAFNFEAQASPQDNRASQEQSTKAAPTQQSSAEITNSENQSIIRVRVPVVVLRVVVKDAAGNVVNNLKKEDFQIQDNNKPQEITTFAVEHPASRTVRNLDENAATAKEDTTGATGPDAIVVASRYVVLLLDDIHIQPDGAVSVRTQAMEAIQSLQSRDLAAVFSTSGRIHQDFTRDKHLLSEMISRFMPAPIDGGSYGACPHITYFQAQLMVNLKDPDATEKAVEDFWSCKYGKNDQSYSVAVRDAAQTAQAVVDSGDVELKQAMRRISELVGALSELPGDRKIVFVSPGFASLDLLGELSPLLDRAIRANVVVDTIDARSLYVPDESLDASRAGSCIAGSMNPAPQAGDNNAHGCNPEAVDRFQFAQQSAMNDVLSGLAAGTGGTWFHNRNDLNKGIHDALSSPETSYVLSFSPQSKSLDGKFHKLKIAVPATKQYSVQARAGYFAAKPASDPIKQAEADFHDALFAQDEMNEIPVDVHSNFFVKDANEASLAVLTHIDIKGLHFQRVSERNYDELTVGVVIFDDHGNFVTGNKRTLTLRLLDESLERVRKTGVSVKMSFDVKPGTYVVRVVASDSVGASMSARNGGVVIPN